VHTVSIAANTLSAPQVSADGQTIYVMAQTSPVLTAGVNTLTPSSDTLYAYSRCGDRGRCDGAVIYLAGKAATEDPSATNALNIVLEDDLKIILVMDGAESLIDLQQVGAKGREERHQGAHSVVSHQKNVVF
jgi:hypothetical protein